MSKYAPLERFLEKKQSEFVSMKFSEIERVLDSDLPPSARKHRAWWSNNPSNSVITYAWLSAGYKTEDVDIENETLVFRRVKKPAPVMQNELDRHPLFGLLAGSVTIADGQDIAGPTRESWGAEGQ